MIRVPLSVVPSQTLSIILDDQNAQISLRQNGDYLYFDLAVDQEPIVRAKLCRDRQFLLEGVHYRGFLGDFKFVDTQGTRAPFYTGLESRYVLVYYANAEL